MANISGSLINTITYTSLHIIPEQCNHCMREMNTLNKKLQGEKQNGRCKEFWSKRYIQ